MMRFFFFALVFSLVSGDSLYAEKGTWQNILPKIHPETAVAGTWTKQGKTLKVSAANGARLALPVTPTGEYDVRVSFTRHTGRDSIALIFVHGSKQATFEVDSWGQHLGGAQNINGQDFRSNSTRKENVQLKNGQRYTMTIEVRHNQIRCLLDETEIVLHQTDGSDLSISSLWRLPETKHLGIGAWNSETTFHTIEVRSHSNEPLQMVRSRTKPASSQAPSSRPSQKKPVPVPSPENRNNGKHVLIIIANRHFFYREYADPKAELEKAGIRVTIAAGVKSPCYPHANSGQGNRPGIVNPDLSLAQVNVKDYDAVLFSGGWGSSSYQYAFNGRYNTASYNGNRSIKEQANRIVNEFLAADKYTCALCNAVSVLAWARVNGKSPLAGKRVCAPTRAAPVGIYNGQRAQPSCRWHPEVNGAVMSPAGSIGRPRTAIDDISVDGKIVTGEDDISAREMGRRIAQLLSQR